MPCRIVTKRTEGQINMGLIIMISKIKKFFECKKKNKNDDFALPIKRPRDCLICDICKEVVISSKTLPCGDSFCDVCLTEHLLTSLVWFM